MNKQELEALLNYHDNLYYNQDAPEISDYEYDALKNQYVEKYGEYNYVPGKADDNKKKFEHTDSILSLDKVQITDEEKLRNSIERLWPVIIQPKFDGLTLVSYPNESNALRCYDLIHVTRGNGHIGEIVTETAKNIKGIGHLGNLRTLPTRSEALMLKSEFNKINEDRIKAGLKPFENTRNAAAGMLRNLDTSKVKGLKVFAYDLIGSTATEEGKLDILKSLGWNVSEFYKPKTIDDAINYINNFDRESLDYDIDGLVIKHNGTKKFGTTEHHPNNAIAVKFAPKGEWTKIKDITWQVGRTGKVTPVAELEPVNILGSTITRATLHNYGIISALNLNMIHFIGKYTPATDVYVIKSNDVIPAIVNVQQPDPLTPNLYCEIIHEPKNCPMCNSELDKVNNQLFCRNTTCPSKTINKLINMAQRDAFDIEGLSEETASKLISKYRDILNTVLHQMDMAEEARELEQDAAEEYMDLEKRLEHMHPSFVFDLKLNDIKSLPGFADKSALNLYNAIQGSKVIPFNRFLVGASIPNIGKKAARNIAEFYYDGVNPTIFNFATDYFNDFNKLKDCKDIGPVMIKSLKDHYVNDIVPFGEYNLNITDVVPKKKAINQLVFVITGEFDIPRNDIKKMIEEAGHKVTGSVSKKTSYLLAAPGEESTSKYKKAKELDTNIINSLEELRNLLEDIQ